MVSSALKNAAMPYANKVFLHCLFRSKSTAIVIMVEEQVILTISSQSMLFLYIIHLDCWVLAIKQSRII